MLDKVRDFIEKYNMLQQGDTVLVAVSGGPDSMVLLDILWQLKEVFRIRLHVAHLNHMFRGEQSLQDAFFVEKFACSLGLPVTYASVDIPSLLSGHSVSTQEIAREVRYAYLERLSGVFSCNKVALGHHMNDQAETVLHNLLRGSGPEGLAGMLPLHRKIIRPLLAVERADIEHYCREKKLKWRYDPSNEKSVYRRNKIRNELIPLLQKEYNPRLVTLLVQTADILQAENAFLDSLALKNLRCLCEQKEGKLSVDIQGFNELHPAVKKRLLRLAAREINNTSLDFYHVERVLDFVKGGQTGKSLTLPGNLILEKSYAIFVLRKGKDDNNKGESFSYLLEVPGKITIREAGLTITSNFGEMPPAFTGNNLQAVLDKDKVEFPITVRTRLAGDRFFPLGAPGEKKLKDFFIDRKVPWRERDKIPLLVDAKSEILWVVGYAISHRARVTQNSQKLLEFRANRN